MNDLRLELRTRNNVLWHLIFDECESVSAFCRARGYGSNEGRIGNFLNLSASPYSSKGVSPLAQRIADDSKLLVEDLFPRTLYAGMIPRRLVAEIPSSAYRGLTAAKRLALPPVQDDVVLRRELRASLAEAMKMLTPREERIVRKRFGFDDEDESTLEEIGLEEGVSKERIRAIEAKALRKLRHPSRAKHLSPYIEQPDTLEEDEPVIEAAPMPATSAATPANIVHVYWSAVARDTYDEETRCVLADGEALLARLNGSRDG